MRKRNTKSKKKQRDDQDEEEQEAARKKNKESKKEKKKKVAETRQEENDEEEAAIREYLERFPDGRVTRAQQNECVDNFIRATSKAQNERVCCASCNCKRLKRECKWFGDFQDILHVELQQFDETQHPKGAAWYATDSDTGYMLSAHGMVADANDTEAFGVQICKECLEELKKNKVHKWALATSGWSRGAPLPESMRELSWVEARFIAPFISTNHMYRLTKVDNKQKGNGDRAPSPRVISGGRVGT